MIGGALTKPQPDRITPAKSRDLSASIVFATYEAQTSKNKKLLFGPPKALAPCTKRFQGVTLVIENKSRYFE